MTGWQLTANRIYLCAMVSAQWATTRWCGSRPTCRDGMRLHSCCGTLSKRSTINGLLNTSKNLVSDIVLTIFAHGENQ